jgi:hypothetical protein
MAQLVECSSCHKEKLCTPFVSNYMMCEECRETQRKYEETLISTENERIAATEAIYNARNLDSRIKISTDIFNAKTVAIHKIKEEIDANPEYTNKHFELAKFLNERFQILSKVIFEKSKEIVEGESEQRAIQIYYNELGKRLREEERNSLRIKDLQYKPLEPAKILKPKKEKLVVKTYDPALIKEAALKFNVLENIVRIFCIQKNIEPMEAAELVRKTLDGVKPNAV